VSQTGVLPEAGVKLGGPLRDGAQTLLVVAGEAIHAEKITHELQMTILVEKMVKGGRAQCTDLPSRQPGQSPSASPTARCGSFWNIVEPVR
jgi:hypothetical protein